jgi:peroxiredoxin Q/BCP
MGIGPLKPLIQLRMIATAAMAMAVGLARTIVHSEAEERVHLQPGDLAPEFALEASDGCTYSLSQYIGSQAVVLAWFPKAFTGGCTAQCESVGASSAELRQFKVAHFGASVDSPETIRRFAASMMIDFPILSDPRRTAARAYGVLGASGFPARQTFFIGIDGRVLAIDRRVRTSTHGTDIVASLARLQIPRQS